MFFVFLTTGLVACCQVLLTTFLAKRFGVNVVEARVFGSPFFKLYSFYAYDLRWIIGWLPIIGSVKLEGMEPNHESAFYAGDFLTVSPWKRSLIIFAWITIAFIIFALFVGGGDIQFAYLLAFILASSIIPGGLYATRRASLNTVGDSYQEHDVSSLHLLGAFVFYLIIMLMQLGLIQAVFYPDLGVLPDPSSIYENVLSMKSSAQRYILISGLFLISINLLPIGGLNGWHGVQLLYEVFSRQNLPHQWVEKHLIIGFLALLPLYGLFLYILVTL